MSEITTASSTIVRGAAWRGILLAAIVAFALFALACASEDSGQAEKAAMDASSAAQDASSAAQEASAAAQQAATAAQNAATAAEEASMAAQNALEAASDTSMSEEATAAAEAASMAAHDASHAAQEAAEAAQMASVAAQDAADAASDTSMSEEAVAAAESAAMSAEEASAAAREAVEAATAAAEAAMNDDATKAAEAAAKAAEEASAAAQKAAEAAASAAASASTPPALPTMADPGELVLYSGRSESLVAPIIAQFEEVTGIDVQIKYGGTSEIAATIMEEGDNSPADVFWAQDPGALAALADRYRPLPSDLTLAVPEWARASDGSWVGISGRARVIVYDATLSEDELPASVEELTDPKWKGRIGWPPTNASFRVMVTAMREMWGEDKTREWLEGMLANDVKVFPKNTPIVAAASEGEVSVGLVNHYYLHRRLAVDGDDFGARNLYLKDGGPASLVMVAGAGVLETGENQDNAEAFVRFLLSKVAQQYFAASTFEYPMIEGVKTHHLLPAIDSLNNPAIDYATLDDLAGTEALLRDTGVIP